jgi:hypothetical protein
MRGKEHLPKRANKKSGGTHGAANRRIILADFPSNGNFWLPEEFEIAHFQYALDL